MSIDFTIIKSKIGKDVVITFLSQFIIMLTFFVVNKILSNSLGVDGYGQYSIIKKNSGVISMVMLGGMGIALPRFLAYYRAKNEEIRANAILVGSLLVILVLSFFIFILFVVFYREFEIIIIGAKQNKELFYATILYSFSICASSFLYSFYRGQGNFIKYNLSQILIQIFILLSCFFEQKHLLDLLIIWSISTLLITLTALIKDTRYIFADFIKNSQINKLRFSFKELVPYGFTRTIGDFVLFSFYALPLFFSNSKYGIRETSYFSVGIMISNMISPFFSFLGMVLLPYVSENIATENHFKIKKAVNILLILYSSISIFVCLFVFIYIDFFIKLFFNSDYLASAGMIKVIIWSVVPQALYLLLRNPLDAISKIPFNTLNLSISFSLMILMFYKSTSIIELSYSFLISNIILAILSVLSWYLFYYRVRSKKIAIQ
jgi:O-antigen/teichoic acid export membrane protein